MGIQLGGPKVLGEVLKKKQLTSLRLKILICGIRDFKLNLSPVL